MEISGLGFFNTNGPSGKQVALGTPPSGEKFMGMMAAIMSQTTGTASEVTEEIGKTGPAAELLEFLKTMDLLDLENGKAILDGLLGNGTENLLDKAFTQLGITAEDITVLLQKWSNAGQEEMSDEELLASVSSIIASMAGMAIHELAGKLDKNDLQVMKAFKMYDLMSKYADSTESKMSSSLKEALQALESKLGALVEQTAGNSRGDYLQKRYTQLAADLNLVNSKNILSENTSEGTGARTETAGGPLSFMPQMTKAEQLTLMLNTPERQVSAEQLMKQFESILAKAQFQNSGGTQKLFIKLYPEHLGSIRVELFQKDQTMVARIITMNGTAKETLESQLGSLKQAFSAQNLSLEKIEIIQQSAQQDRFLNRDSQQQHRHPDAKEEDRHSEEKDDFSVTFEEALLNMEA